MAVQTVLFQKHNTLKWSLLCVTSKALEDALLKVHGMALYRMLNTHWRDQQPLRALPMVTNLG